MTTVQIKNLLGTYIDQNVPSKNYASGQTMYLRGGSSVCYGYLYFSRPFPLGATIVSAKLKLYNTAALATGTHNVYARRLNQPLSIAGVTYNTRATNLMSSEKVVTKTGTVTANQLWELDIKTDMQAVADGTKWYGYQIRTSDTTNIAMTSPRHPSVNYRPWVEIVWSDAPDTPERLSPNGGRVVSTATPILRFDYTDVSGDTSLSNVQVQVNTTSSFTSPAYSSGTVATTDPQFDLTGNFTCTAGTTYYWRVRVQDGAGLWSGWSSPASFVYRALPTLTVNNPAVSPNNYVTEPTPPIDWSVTGGTQTAYQLGLYSDSNGDLDGFSPKYEWGRGKTLGTTTAVTLPSGFIRDVAGQYRIDVRIYDSYDREAVPNGLPYAQVTRLFTYQYSSLTAGVTSLAASPLDPRPGITLSWSRSTAPDTFSITRDGLVILSGAASDSLFVSGTSYAWTDTKPVKGKAHVYSVQAVVNGKASLTNPTVTSTNSSLGTWIMALDGSSQVCLVSDKDRTMTYAEQSTAHEIVGSVQKVLITQSLGTLEGAIKGKIVKHINSALTESVATWKSRYLSLKANAGQRMILFVQGGTYEVVCRNMQISRDPSPNDVWNVEFEFFGQANSLDFRPAL